MLELVWGELLRHIRYNKTSVIRIENTTQKNTMYLPREDLLTLLQEEIRPGEEIVTCYFHPDETDFLRSGAAIQEDESIRIADIKPEWVHKFLDSFDRSGFQVKVTTLASERPFLRGQMSCFYWLIVMKPKSAALGGELACEEVESIGLQLSESPFVGACS